MCWLQGHRPLYILTIGLKHRKTILSLKDVVLKKWQYFFWFTQKPNIMIENKIISEVKQLLNIVPLPIDEIRRIANETPGGLQSSDVICRQILTSNHQNIS